MEEQNQVPKGGGYEPGLSFSQISVLFLESTSTQAGYRGSLGLLTDAQSGSGKLWLILPDRAYIAKAALKPESLIPFLY